MNSYSKTLLKGLDELDEYVRRSGEQDWCPMMRRLARQAAEAPDDASAEDALSHLSYFIVDSGPVGDDYSPSLSAAIDAMQRRNKRK